MIDLAMIAKGVKAAHWARALLNRKEEERTQAMNESYALAKEDWAHERNRLLAERVSRLEDTEENRRLFENLWGDEFLWLLANYQVEAVRESRRERRRMLAYASAGSVDLRLTVDELSRVERVVRMLSPDDLLLLRESRDLDGDRKECRERLNSAPLSRDALLSSGCLFGNQAGFGGITSFHVRDIGNLVLRVMSDYIEVRHSERTQEAEPK